MARTVLIDRSFGETRLAILTDDRLTDLYLYRDEDPDLTGSIHQARVRRVMPALGGAFLDLGTGEAFLKTKSPPPEGSLVTVEIRAEGGPGKLPIATLNLSRAVQPQDDRPQGEKPLCLHHDPAPWLRQAGDGVIFTNAPDICNILRAAGRDAHFSQDDLFAPLEDDISALGSAEIALGSGARLWIEGTRALTAIDLDSGGLGEGRASPAAARAVNDRAVPEIARQLRLRRIGGLVVIDFLRLPDKAARLQLTDRLTAALGDDPIPSEVTGFSRLGLFELKRPRSGRPLARDLGQNDRPPLATLARQCLRAAARAARHAPGRPQALSCAPVIADWIERHDMAARFRSETGAALVISPDPALAPDRFSV